MKIPTRDKNPRWVISRQTALGQNSILSALVQKRTNGARSDCPLSAGRGRNERRRQARWPRPARYRYFPGSGGPEPPAGAGGRLSGAPLPVPLPPFAFLTLPLEVLAGASAGPGCVGPCATLMFEFGAICGAFCACATVASAKRLTHITDPRIRNDIVGPSWNCRSTTALNPRGAVFSSVIFVPIADSYGAAVGIAIHSSLSERKQRQQHSNARMTAARASNCKASVQKSVSTPVPKLLYFAGCI